MSAPCFLGGGDGFTAVVGWFTPGYTGNVSGLVAGFDVVQDGQLSAASCISPTSRLASPKPLEAG